MRDDGPSGQRGQVDERGDDQFTRAPLDPARAPALPRALAPAATLGRALRGPRRSALTLAATTLLVAAVVVGLFVHVASDPRGAVGALLGMPSPTPAATFIPGANVIYFSDGAPWGTLTVDGKRLPQADLSGYGTAVTRGAHHLVYQARYFPTLRCVFSAPQAQSDTCRLDTSDGANQFLVSKAPLARMIDLGSTDATLQPDQRAAIFQVATSQLQEQSQTATIAPGERYLDDQGRVVVASAPLQFHVSLSLSDSATNAGAGCVQICSEPFYSDSPGPPGGGWLAQVTVAVSWFITDNSGRRLTSAGYLVMDGQPISTLVGIQLTTAGWKLNWLDDLAVEAVEDAASAAAYQAESDMGFNDNGMSFALAPNPLDGCVMDVYNGNGNTPARVFWRFGALLAVDKTARNMLTLPAANAQEQAAVTSILARPPATPATPVI